MTELIAVTGANGFIGRSIVEQCDHEHRSVRRIVRTPKGAQDEVAVGEIGASTDWSTALERVGTVIHCAGLARNPDKESSNAQRALEEANVSGLAAMAEHCLSAGVRRIVLLSSVKVNGEFSVPASPFRHDDIPQPKDAYARSKLAAELELKRICEHRKLEYVIIRSPLVYGPRVAGNFRGMVRWVERGIPLPLSGIENSRSLIGIGNLVDLVLRCCTLAEAANRTFLVSDDQDVSTPELLRAIGQALGRPPRLFPLPISLLESAAKVFGKSDAIRRLCGSLQVDIGSTKDQLAWRPRESFHDGIARTVRSIVGR